MNSRFADVGFLGDITRGVLLNGNLTMGICILGIFGVIVADLRALYTVPATIRPNAMKIEKFPSARWWTLERISRRMSYSYHRFMLATEKNKEQAAVQYLGFRNFAIEYHRGKNTPSPQPVAKEESAVTEEPV